jgi:hypothetical protein
VGAASNCRGKRIITLEIDQRQVEWLEDLEE